MVGLFLFSKGKSISIGENCSLIFQLTGHDSTWDYKSAIEKAYEIGRFPYGK